MTLEFTAGLPEDVPETVPVYRLQPPETGPASVGRLVEVSTRMGLAGRPRETSLADDRTTYREGLWELGFYSRSGATIGRHRARYHRPGDRSFELSDDEAIRIAADFLERTEILSPGETRMVGVTHLRTAGAGRNGQARETTTIDAGVVVGRSVGGLDVDGPGGSVMVNIHGDGDVVGFRSIWRPVAEAVVDVEIRPPDVAYESIRQIASRTRGDLEVTKAMFGYFEQGLLDTQSFLQPAYLLVYVVRDEEVSFRSAEVVAASERQFEPLLGAKRFGDRRQPNRD